MKKTKDGKTVVSPGTTEKSILPQPKKSGKSLQLHVVIDTEFATIKDSDLDQQTRTPISTQMKIFGHEDNLLFFDADIAQKANKARKRAGLDPAPVLKTEFAVLDLLNHYDEKWELWRPDEPISGKMKELQVTLYAHFALAEINQIFRGDFGKVIMGLQRDGKINMQRRLIAGSNPYQESVATGYLIKINGEWYSLKLRFIDTCAVHGVASYGDFCKNTKTELKFKDSFTSEEKGRMLDMVVERPVDFENYALGDLEIDKALTSYVNQMKEIYKSLEIENFYRQPKLTIGGTVKGLFEAKLAQALGIDETNDDGWVDIFNEEIVPLFSHVSTQELVQYTKETRSLLAKVQGGRCRNNKPTVTVMEDVLCDIDISGCYGEGQRNQEYPIGNPEIFDFKVSPNNYYPTLQEWLKMYGVKQNHKSKKIKDYGDLLPGLWHARISTFEPLEFPQDLIESWVTSSKKHEVDLLAKFVREMKCDTENEGRSWVDFDTEYGGLKINHNEIHNGVLTHDLLQILINYSSPEQRQELLNKIRVTASMVYPKCHRIVGKNALEALELLKSEKDSWKYKNTTVRKQKTRYTLMRQDTREYHGWFSVNLGDLIINDLLIERKKAKILHGKKSPEQTLFKLCVNTLYGDMVSRFFVTSNPTVGNNITGRARALAYCMEKGLNGWQSITDGCVFQLNRVPAKTPKVDKACNLSKWLDSKKVKPLGGEKSDQTRNRDWINQNAWEHLTRLYSDLDIFKSNSSKISVCQKDNALFDISFEPCQGQFEFEVKDVYETANFHGSANYRLDDKYKMRGYENNKQHIGVELVGEELVTTDRYQKESPSIQFLNALKNPHAVTRQSVAIKTRILKLSEYQNHSEKYDRMGLKPGDNLVVPMLMHELSLSQFTFKTHEQWLSWTKVIDKRNQKYGQSLEAWFLNEDDTLDYQEMIEWVQDAIERGVMNPIEELDPHNHQNRDLGEKLKHPAWQCLQKTKERLDQPIKTKPSDDSDKAVVLEKKRVSVNEILGLSTALEIPELVELEETVVERKRIKSDDLLGLLSG